MIIPQPAQRLREVARRLHPGLILYITFEPRDAGPLWQYRPFRHWLVLHGEGNDEALAGVACALVARSFFGWCLVEEITPADPAALEAEIDACVQILKTRGLA